MTGHYVRQNACTGSLIPLTSNTRLLDSLDGDSTGSGPSRTSSDRRDGRGRSRLACGSQSTRHRRRGWCRNDRPCCSRRPAMARLCRWIPGTCGSAAFRRYPPAPRSHRRPWCGRGRPPLERPPEPAARYMTFGSSGATVRPRQYEPPGNISSTCTCSQRPPRSRLLNIAT